METKPEQEISEDIPPAFDGIMEGDRIKMSELDGTNFVAKFKKPAMVMNKFSKPTLQLETKDGLHYNLLINPASWNRIRSKVNFTDYFLFVPTDTKRNFNNHKVYLLDIQAVA